MAGPPVVSEVGPVIFSARSTPGRAPGLLRVRFGRPCTSSATEPDFTRRTPMPHDAGEHLLVLVVAADPDTRAILSELLGIEGFSIIEASHADDAWEVIAEGRVPHVILLDLRDPSVDGEAFRSQQLASAHGDTPVVIMTSAHVHASDGTLAWCTVLEKPFEVEALLAALACATPGTRATIRPR